MAMTLSREKVYRRKWYDKESQIDKRNRRKEINRKIRYASMELGCNRKELKNLTKLRWRTMS